MIGGLGAIALVLGAVGVLAGPSAAPQFANIPSCGACNVIVVAKDGGNFTDPIAAMAHIASQSPSAANRFLLYIAPGTYELSGPLRMLSYVDVQGAGEAVTILTRVGSDISPFTDDSSSTVSGANSSELRYLTVLNTGGSDNAIGIHNDSASPKLSHVTVTASGGATRSYGVFNNGSSPITTHVTAFGVGGTFARGVSNYNSSPLMTNVIAIGIGGENSSVGVRNDNSSPIMTNLSAVASSGFFNYGVFNINNASPTIRGSTIKAFGSKSYGIFSSGGAGKVVVSDSLIAGVTATIDNTAGHAIRVNDSQLEGGAVIIGGDLECRDSFDANLIYLNDTCG